MIAIVSLTEGGKDLAERLLEAYEADHFHKPKPFKEKVEDLFKSYDVLVFIMATGIVVRTLKDVLDHKSIDPAVLVMDEKANHVISLLSGHLGGGNFWTNNIANFLGSSPVITTSSDVNEVMSIDMLAQKYNLVLRDFEHAKLVTAELVNGHTIQTVGFTVDEKLYSSDHGQAVVYIGSCDEQIRPAVQLYKKNIVLGIGCRRDTKFDELYQFVKEELQDLDLPLEVVSTISTAWVKADELAILSLQSKLNCKLNIYTKSDITSVMALYDGSEFVFETIGVTGVAEPCGHLGSNHGKCLLGKKKNNGMTLSIWESK